MNIEIANRLVNLRKKNNLSQEELAAKLGISRQAVSKWERAEASPDTDNLIMLARLYGISLDEMLSSEESIESAPPEKQPEPESEPENAASSGTKVNISFKDGIHVIDDEDEVHIGWKGIHVTEKGGDDVHIDGKRIYVNGRPKKPKRTFGIVLKASPYVLIVVVAYLLMGFISNLWHPGWIVFMSIPLYYSISNSVANGESVAESLNHFPFAVACAVAYLLMGFLADLWHPGWIVFLLVPIYHSVVGAIVKFKDED